MTIFADAEPSGIMYWLATAVTVLGGGAGIRKILMNLRATADAVSMIPDLVKTQQAQAVRIAADEAQTLTLKTAADETAKTLASLAAKVAELDHTLGAWMGTAADGMFVCDNAGRTVWVNPEIVRATQGNREDLLAGGWSANVAAEERERVTQIWGLFVAGRRSRFEMKCQFLPVNGGAPVTFLVSAARVPEAASPYTRIVGILRRYAV